MRGRPRKPAHIKEQQGTFEPSRELARAITDERLTVVPDCPAEFTQNERDFFTYCCRVLIRVGVLTPQFILDIQTAATWYHVAKEAAARLREPGGIVQRYTSGATGVPAHLTAYEKATRALSDFNNHYGFNLTASQRIEMPKLEDDDDLTK